MSILGDTPHYILAQKRSDGLIDYAVFNPRGWSNDDLIHVAPCAASTEQQILGRAQRKLLASQNGLAEITYVEDLAGILKRY